MPLFAWSWTLNKHSSQKCIDLVDQLHLHQVHGVGVGSEAFYVDDVNFTAPPPPQICVSISDLFSLQGELERLWESFLQKGYRENEVHRARNHAEKLEVKWSSGLWPSSHIIVWHLKGWGNQALGQYPDQPLRLGRWFVLRSMILGLGCLVCPRYPAAMHCALLGKLR